MSRGWIGSVALVLALCAWASADTFKLKPGHEHNGRSVIQGKKLGQTGTKWIIKTDEGEVVTIEEADFEEVAAGENSDAKQSAEELGLPTLTFEPLYPDYTLQQAVSDAKEATPACPDMVVLTDGRRLVGTATPTDTGLSINVSGERTDLASDDIREILPSPDRAFQEHLRAADGAGVEAWLDIARWCLEEPLLSDGRRKAVLCLQVAQSLDPEDADVRDALGYQQVQGEWLRGEELAAALGSKRENGKWVGREVAELEAVKERVVAWADIEQIGYRDAIRRVEDDVDVCQVHAGKGDTSFKPWRDECLLKTSSEERSWAAAKRNSRVNTMMAYAKKYASMDAASRRDERTKVMELERADQTDIWNCAECGGSVNYNAQETCPTCGGESSGGGGGGGVAADPGSCGKCGGSGSRKCPKCGGKAKVDCRKCAFGVKGGADCPYCVKGEAVCPKCNGQKTITCDHGAGGGGGDYAGGGSKPACSTCNGSGYVNTAKGCKKCGGTGRAHQTPGFHSR